MGNADKGIQAKTHHSYFCSLFLFISYSLRLCLCPLLQSVPEEMTILVRSHPLDICECAVSMVRLPSRFSLKIYVYVLFENTITLDLVQRTYEVCKKRFWHALKQVRIL